MRQIRLHHHASFFMEISFKLHPDQATCPNASYPALSIRESVEIQASPFILFHLLSYGPCRPREMVNIQAFCIFGLIIALLLPEVDCGGFSVVLIFFSSSFWLWIFFRRAVIRAATIEEIEAEKALIEKDVVSSYDHWFGELLHLLIKQSKFRKNCANNHPITFQRARMEKTIDTVRSSFNSIRTGRANPAMLDKIEVLAILKFGSLSG